MTTSRKRWPVLVPYWIVQQLKRNQLPLNTILNLKALAEVCSQEDQAILLDLNEHPTPITGTHSIGGELTQYWQKYSPEQLRRLLQITALYQGSCDARLYSDRSTVTAETKAFDVQEIDSGLDATGVLLIILYPGHFNASNTELQQCVRREYLKQSYVFLKFDDIAKDPVFMQYLLNV